MRISPLGFFGLFLTHATNVHHKILSYGSHAEDRRLGKQLHLHCIIFSLKGDRLEKLMLDRFAEKLRPLWHKFGIIEKYVGDEVVVRFDKMMIQLRAES